MPSEDRKWGNLMSKSLKEPRVGAGWGFRLKMTLKSKGALPLRQEGLVRGGWCHKEPGGWPPWNKPKYSK